MNVMSFIYRMITDILFILRNERGTKNKISMLLTYNKLTLKYLLFVKFLNIKLKREKILGYELTFFDYAVLRSTFIYMFVHKEYEFNGADRPLIIDCGSNIGIGVLFFKKKYPTSRIICFEPDKKTFQLLKHNVEKNQIRNVDLNEAVLYKKEGKIKFYSYADNEGSLGMSINKNLLEEDSAIKESVLKSVRLSNYINEPVDFLKMNIEGTEGVVIKELSERRKLGLIKQMIIKYHGDHPNNNLDEIIKLLKVDGFKFIIHSPKKSPYYLHKEKIDSLTIYAYR